MQQDFETFLILFGQLRNAVKDRPERLKWLAREEPAHARLSFDLSNVALRIDRNFTTKDTKHTVIPRGFLTAWRDFQKRWRDAVHEASADQRREADNTFHEFLERIFEEAEAKGKDPDDVYRELLSQAGIEVAVGRDFDPLSDDAGKLVEELFDDISELVENELLPSDFYDKAVGAWEFLRNVLRLDVRQAYDRWRSSPELFIPKHATAVNIDAVTELYNQAVRSFVFGNDVAAIAMCRALLEHILKKHYRIDGEDLSQIVSLAEEKFNRLKSLHLQRKRVAANRLLHQFEKTGVVQADAVVDYLKAIRELVQSIPSR